VTGSGLEIRPAADCRYDIVALGEIMLRLDPGEGRIRNAREFRAWEGGGEYNVARGLRRCFGLRSAVVTAFVDNEIGRLLEDLVLQGGVDTSHISWLPFDGTGRDVRNGLNFTERGFGVRGAVGVSDRAHTAAGRIAPGDVDWHDLFGRQGARWFHTGGIYAAISPSAPLVIAEAIEAARAHGVIVSYDLNYRPSLWRALGGVDEARRVNRELVRQVDVVIGNEEDFTACLGLEVEGVDENLTTLDSAQFEAMIDRAATTYPNLQVIATTLRAVHSANRNDWGAVAWSRTHGFAKATPRTGLEILDRVGGGDSFVAGLAYGLMELGELALAVEYGAAHGALAMTTPGDTSVATLAEVEALVSGGGARVKR
jgi:2-dehydro-3-deoxygluconokinase